MLGARGEQRGLAPPDVIVADWPMDDRDPAWRPGDPPLVALVNGGGAPAARAALRHGAADCVIGAAAPVEVALRVATVCARVAPAPAPESAGPLTRLLEALPAGVAVVAPDGTVAQVNEEMCLLCGLSRDQLVGRRDVHEHLLGGDAAAIADLFHQADTRPRAVAHTTLPRGSDRIDVTLTVTANRDDTGVVSAYLVSARVRDEHEVVAESLARLADTACHDQDAVMASIAHEALGLTTASAAVVLHSGDEGMTVVARAGDGAPAEGTFVAGQDARQAAARLMRSCIPGLTWVYSVPMRAAGRTWGRVVVAGGGDHHASREGRLQRFGQVASIAAGSVASAASAGDSDPLTGLLSNAAFFARLTREIARARENQTPLSLAIVDLDRFKRVNERHGHVVGDMALTEVARRLRDAALDGHAVGRLGGEEFGWIMPGVPQEEAFDHARAARHAIVSTAVGEAGTLRASMGIAEVLGGHAESVEELRQQAEVALHWAKVSGGNRCVSYSFTVAEQVFARKSELNAEGPSLRAMRALAWAVDARDPHTQRHSIRVADLAVRIAVALGWSVERAAPLREAGLVHDVGKIAVPDRILFKPTRLTAEEFAIVTRHPTVGAQIVADVLSAEQASWVRAHHERWDGRGYPQGLAGEEIPEEARVLALADAWDVMTSVRSYKDPVSVEGALAEIERCSGSQFWPPAVAALRKLVESGVVGADTGRASTAREGVTMGVASRPVVQTAEFGMQPIR